MGWLPTAPACLLVLALPAHAVEVEVAGVGPLSLEEATQGCLSDAPLASGTQVAAFQDFLKLALQQPEAFRQAAFAEHGAQVWPTAEVQVTYAGELQWAPAGVAAACTAVGQHWVREGARLSALCRDSKGACRNAFDGPGEVDLVKAALKLQKQSDDDSTDAFFAALNADEAALVHWSNPQPFLDKACSAPAATSFAGQFLSRTDLAQARVACVQLLSLLERGLPGTIPGSECDTPWHTLADDAPSIVAAPDTDLGITDDRSVQVFRLGELLTRMDPTAERCALGWAQNWRGGLVPAWREAQSKRACADEELPLEPRSLVCPTLATDKRMACMSGDGAACLLAGTMLAEGIRFDVDLEGAVSLFAKSCDAGHQPGCEAIRGQEEAITGWFDALLEGAAPLPPPPPPEPPAEPPDEEVEDEPPDDAPEELELPTPPTLPEGAHEALAEADALRLLYAEVLGEEWDAERLRALFVAAMLAWDVPRARALIEAHGTALAGEIYPEDFVAQTIQQLEGMQAALDAPDEEPEEG